MNKPLLKPQEVKRLSDRSLYAMHLLSDTPPKEIREEIKELTWYLKFLMSSKTDKERRQFLVSVAEVAQ
jgi:hypothetical protein